MARIKKKEHERLDDTTISRVVVLLEQEKPITKKAACEILNINYSTIRLGKIIQEYKDKIEYTKKRMKINKGKPFNDFELKELVADYLNGESITNIASNLYRSIHVVKKKIIELNLPERTKNSTYWNPNLIPDEAVSEFFEIGELVWAAKYNAVAEIRNIKSKTALLDNLVIDVDTVYSIWVFGKHNEFAYQPWWELGKLEAVKQFGLTVDKFIKTEKPNFQYRIE